MRSWTWLYSGLGTLFSIVALISLCTKMFHVGIMPVAADIVATYRAVFHPIAAFLLGWTHWIWPHWQVPAWVKDLYSLSFIGASGLARGIDNAAEENEKNGVFVTAIAALVIGAVFLGIFIAIAAPLMAFGVLDEEHESEKEKRENRIIGYNVLAAILGTAAFFALNYTAMHGSIWSQAFS